MKNQHHQVEITLPKLGESIVGATVVKWLKKEGDPVTLDEALVEVSTDKVNSEIPSPYSGVLEKILAPEGAEIEVGAPLATLFLGEKASLPLKKEEASPDFYSPAVMRLAQMEGVSLDTLRTIEGSGGEGRVTKRDLENYLESKKGAPPCPLKGKQAGEEREKLTGLRKAIADNLVRSFYEAPHASLVIEADVTDVMQVIAREKESFLAAHGVKLTITSFLVQAIVKAVERYPRLNASLEGETIILKRYVNVGIAVHVEQGLMVPVIKSCQDRNLVSLAKAIGDLSGRARQGKLSHDDVREGTITLTNFGMTGALIGVPIIRFPEVAIVGAGTIKKRVVVREDEALAIRHMMYLTLTFDHRVIDGIYGCDFLNAMKENLESVTVH